MSTSRGNQSRRRPQKHQNRTAFKNDLHDTSQRTKIINSLDVSGVCKRCKDIIQWKIKYKKYKPLTAPAKCVGCNEKAVKHAYHVLCSKCAAEKKVCSKCTKPAKDDEHDEGCQLNRNTNFDTELQAMLKSLPERKRRTVLRNLQKEEGKMAPEMKNQIEDMLAGINDLKFDDNSDISSEDLSFKSDDDNTDENK